jgi:hypothetical protein
VRWTIHCNFTESLCELSRCGVIISAVFGENCRDLTPLASIPAGRNEGEDHVPQDYFSATRS